MAEKKYIEVEALLDRVYAVRDKLQLDLNNPFEDGVRIGFENVEIEIENYPAADVRPVVRGVWVEENGEDAHTGELWCIWKCSECGARRTAGWRHTQEGRKPRDNFCPNCGADMMEES